MKMTIVTDSHGQLAAAVSGHALTAKYGELKTEVSFPHDHKLHTVEVEDDIAKITDAAVFYDRLLKHVPKA